MIIKNKPLHIQLNLHNGGRWTIRENSRHFDIKKLIKRLDEVIPMARRVINNPSYITSSKFSKDDLKIQYLELLEARLTLTKLMEEN